MAFLAWEYSGTGNALLRFGKTILEGTLCPRRLLRRFRRRTEIPIRKPWAFLSLAIGTILAVSFAGVVLEVTVTVFWRTGSLGNIPRVVRSLWAYSGAIQVVMFLQAFIQFLAIVTVASLATLCVGRTHRAPGPGFKNISVLMSIVILPYVACSVVVQSAEVVQMALGLIDEPIMAAYIDYIVIVASSVVLFFVGVTGIGIPRRRMAAASVGCFLGSWICFFTTTNLSARITLALLGQR